jgi:methionyl aminopeptidase
LFKGVRSPSAKLPFPSAICTSVNEEVVHGIPSDRVLAEGDIVSIDCGVRMRGYCGDSATTFAVGSISAEARRLLEVTAGALDLAISEVCPGRYWSEIAALIQQHVQSAGFSVVREFVGHGIGQDMHEEPKVPNYADHRQSKADLPADGPR